MCIRDSPSSVSPSRTPRRRPALRALRCSSTPPSPDLRRQLPMGRRPPQLRRGPRGLAHLGCLPIVATYTPNTSQRRVELWGSIAESGSTLPETGALTIVAGGFNFAEHDDDWRRLRATKQ
eukprot:10039783-Alexandrium_andersonii.AAC.1